MASRFQSRCHKLYFIAARADGAYSNAIKRHVGKQATRWTISRAQKEISAVKKAYNRKVRIDNALHRCNVAMRRR